MKYGDDWYHFLKSCRTVLGCEGGASILDEKGRIRNKVEKYLMKKPDSSFAEVKRKCFNNEDKTLKLESLSPRHFEACMTKTCQILVEGKYGGIFKPNIHYIPIKRDWSNIPRVIRKIKDVTYCQKIAENAYNDIVLSKKYTYKMFVERVFSTFIENYSELNKNQADTALDFILLARLRLHYILILLFKILRKFINLIKKIFLFSYKIKITVKVLLKQLKKDLYRILIYRNRKRKLLYKYIKIKIKNFFSFFIKKTPTNNKTRKKNWFKQTIYKFLNKLYKIYHRTEILYSPIQIIE